MTEKGKKILCRFSLESIISIMANVCSIVAFALSNLKDDVLWKFGIVILLVINGYLVYRNCTIKKKIHCLAKKCDEYNTVIERIVEDIVAGKVSSETIPLYYMKERLNKFVKYLKLRVNVAIIYKEHEKNLDVRYQWIISGLNVSDGNVVSELNFLIGGDSSIKNNDVLKLEAEIKVNDKWRRINTSIRGGERFKLVCMQFGDYAIAPNNTFEIRFNYIWPYSYCAEGDKFSFGGNSVSSKKACPMNIKIEADERCFSNAFLEVRNSLEDGSCKPDYCELDVVTTKEKNIVTVNLPENESNRTIYIMLAP